MPTNLSKEKKIIKIIIIPKLGFQNFTNFSPIPLNSIYLSPRNFIQDIRDQLKATQIPYPIKNKIVTITKEAEVLTNCNKLFGPYLRRGLVDLRQVIKKKYKLPEEHQTHVLDEYYLFKEIFEKIKSKKYQIIEAAEAKRVAIDRKRKLFQVSFR